MATVRKLKIEPLTEEAFRPYGELISAKDRTPDYENEAGSKVWSSDVQVDGAPQLVLVRGQYLGFQFKIMEQQYGVTMSYIPMGGPPCVLAVAPPTDRDASPKPEDVRAFLLDGSQGYVLKRNTWHALDRFPLFPGVSDWIVFTDRETIDDLKASNHRGARLTRMIDFEAETGLVLELVL